MDYSVLSFWDLAVVAAYLLTMILVGVYSVKRVKNAGDYFVAGRSFGPLVLMATVCATIIGGSGLMGRAGVRIPVVLRQFLQRCRIFWVCSFFPVSQEESPMLVCGITLRPFRSLRQLQRSSIC